MYIYHRLCWCICCGGVSWQILKALSRRYTPNCLLLLIVQPLISLQTWPFTLLVRLERPACSVCEETFTCNAIAQHWVYMHSLICLPMASIIHASLVKASSATVLWNSCRETTPWPDDQMSRIWCSFGESYTNTNT